MSIEFADRDKKKFKQIHGRVKTTNKMKKNFDRQVEFSFGTIAVLCGFSCYERRLPLACIAQGIGGVRQP
jgi:hypothetical protein